VSISPSPYSIQPGDPPSERRRIKIAVVTSGGVEDLSRAVGVLALYGLTPGRLAAEACGGDGLRLTAKLEGDALTLQRTENRMRALACVVSVNVTDINAPRRRQARSE